MFDMDIVRRLSLQLICIVVVDVAIMGGLSLQRSGRLGQESLAKTANSTAIQLDVSQPAAKSGSSSGSREGLACILRRIGDGEVDVGSGLVDSVPLAKRAPLVVHRGRPARRGKLDVQVGTTHRLQAFECHVELHFGSPQGCVVLARVLVIHVVAAAAWTIVGSPRDWLAALISRHHYVFMDPLSSTYTSACLPAYLSGLVWFDATTLKVARSCKDLQGCQEAGRCSWQFVAQQAWGSYQILGDTRYHRGDNYGHWS